MGNSYITLLLAGRLYKTPALKLKVEPGRSSCITMSVYLAVLASYVASYIMNNN